MNAMEETDFGNTLETLGLSPLQCNGFEEEAFGAMYGLLHFRAMSVIAQHAWDAVVRRGMADRSPTTGRRVSLGVFYMELQQLRFNAYGIDLDFDSESLVANPWSLSDTEFAYCYTYVRDGNKADLKEYDKHLLNEDERYWTGFAYTGGSFLLGEFLKRAAPGIFVATGAIIQRLSGWLFAEKLLSGGLEYCINKFDRAEPFSMQLDKERLLV